MIEGIAITLFVILIIAFLLYVINITYYFFKDKEFIENLSIKLFFLMIILWIIMMILGAFT